MEHRHPYTARGVLTALGKSALYVLFFLGVQLLTGAIYAAIAIAGSSLGEAYLAPFSDVKMGSAVVRHRYGGKGGK